MDRQCAVHHISTPSGAQDRANAALRIIDDLERIECSAETLFTFTYMHSIEDLKSTLVQPTISRRSTAWSASRRVSRVEAGRSDLGKNGIDKPWNSLAAWLQHTALEPDGEMTGLGCRTSSTASIFPFLSCSTQISFCVSPAHCLVANNLA